MDKTRMITNFSDIFNIYQEGDIDFYLLNKAIIFPDDKQLDIYKKVFVPEDIAWTVLSYKLYGSIEYWWVLCAINRKGFNQGRSNIFCATAGSYCYYIDKDTLKVLLQKTR